MTENDKLVLQINQQFKVGDAIKFQNSCYGCSSTVRWPAEILDNGRAVIWVTGEANAVDLKDIKHEYNEKKNNGQEETC